MNGYGVVIKPAKFALILFALSIFAALLLVTGLHRYRNNQEQSLKQTEQQLADTQKNVRKLSYDLETIQQLALKYRKLASLGFIGVPDRDGWVQRLDSIYRQMQLPPTLRYTLAPAQLINPQALETAVPYQNNVSHHDLTLELSGIHEVEFTDFMHKLSRDWQAPYRIETCQMSRDDDPLTGLQIKCTVQLYSLPGK